MIYDVAIIGSGPSAVSAYHSLIKKAANAKFCILEAGCKLHGYSGKYNVLPSSNFGIDPSHYLGFGGTSELWHYVLAPFDPIDFEYRPKLNCNGWPISFLDLKEYYEEALSLLGVSNTKVFWNQEKEFDLKELDLGVLNDVIEPKLFIQLKKRWRAKQYWENQNVEIKFEHFVRGLNVMSNSVEIIASDMSGRELPSVISRKVIVAAGGLNTPQIIYNSAIDLTARKSVGKTLLDHPMGVGMQIKRTKSYNFEILTSKKERKFNKKIAFRIKDSIQREEGLPNSSFYFRPSFKEGYSNTTEELKRKILVYRDGIKRGKIPFKLGIDLMRDWNLLSQVIAYKTGIFSNASLFDIFCVTEQISRESKIVFERGLDGFFYGKCCWSVGDIDESLNYRCLSKISESIDALKTNDHVTVRPEYISWVNRATSAAHHMGTVPMANNAEQGALDRNCSVFGLNESVFVADASVLPSAGCANVTLTSMAIACRVGDYVSEIL